LLVHSPPKVSSFPKGALGQSDGAWACHPRADFVLVVRCPKFAALPTVLTVLAGRESFIIWPVRLEKPQAVDIEYKTTTCWTRIVIKLAR
jgi:hypothetical protein